MIAASDPMVANPGRLRILTVLASAGSAGGEFVTVRERTGLTDGNLSAHARRLAGAGLIAINKQFRAGRPTTTYTLTRDGRAAMENHLAELNAALRPVEMQPLARHDASRDVPNDSDQDDWID